MSVPMSAVPASAIERLSDGQRGRLDSVCASFAMEQMDITDQARDVVAQFILDELTFDQAVAALDALDR